MSFRRRLLQLVGERSQVPQCSLKPNRIRPVFQWLTENDVCEFESSQPNHAVGLRGVIRMADRLTYRADHRTTVAPSISPARRIGRSPRIRSAGTPSATTVATGG